MKYRFFLPALLMVLFPLFTYAQKDAPVAGHAAVLTDLLKKNYNAIEPAQREEEISRDRTQVLAIFKSYLQDKELVNITVAGFNSAKQELKQRQENLIASKRNLDNYMAQEKKVQTIINSLTDINVANQISVNDQRFLVDTLEFKAIDTAYSNNKLVKDIIGKFIIKYTALQHGDIDKNASANAASDIQKSIPFLGGNLGFETIIDGLGRFIAKRLKEELTTYAIDRVKHWLRNPDPNDPLTDLKILLPKTTSYLLGFKADQVTNFPNEIKQYIEDDLSHILDNAGNLRNTPRVERLLLQYPDLDFAFEALQLIPQISKVKTPVDYFTILESSRNINRWKGDTAKPVQFNIANGVSLTGLLARSLVVIDNGEKRFAGTEFLTTYAQESTFYSLYAGFIYQQDLKYYKIKFLNEDKQMVIFSDSYKKKIVDTGIIITNIEFFREIITRTAQNAEKVFNNATELRKASKAGQKPGADTIYNFVKSIIDFSDDATHAADTLLDFLGRTDPPLYDLMHPYFSVANTTNEVVYDIQRKKYTTALLKAVEITVPLVNRNQVSGVNALAQSLSNSSYSPAATNWSEVVRCFKDTSGVSTGKHVKSIPAKDKLRESLIIVASELNKIKLYYRVNYNETTLNDPLNEFIAVCEQGFATKTIVRNDRLKRVIALINSNKDFQELVVSYYANTNIKSSIDRLNTEMTNMKIEGTATKPEMPLILPSEREAITTGINNYVTALFNYFIDNSNTEKKSLDAARLNMEATIRRGLASIPQQTNAQLNSNVVSLIHFVNDMAEAKDAGDVETAIEAFVLPAGSYAIKRKARYNFSLNSYPGILASLEYSPGEGQSFSTGFTAPVGLSLSWGNQKQRSLGVFLSIIDIGAVTRLRLDNSDATSALPEFNFENILAPGVYFTYGFRNSPLSLYLGGQYGPKLRVITNGEAKNYDSYRFSLGVVMDLPLLNLHTRPH